MSRAEYVELIVNQMAEMIDWDLLDNERDRLLSDDDYYKSWINIIPTNQMGDYHE